MVIFTFAFWSFSIQSDIQSVHSTKVDKQPHIRVIASKMFFVVTVTKNVVEVIGVFCFDTLVFRVFCHFCPSLHTHTLDIVTKEPCFPATAC